MKFTTQKEHNTCALVALINALRWQHRAAPTIKWLKRELRVNAGGTNFRPFRRYCKSIGYPQLEASPEQMDLALSLGDGVILGVPVFNSLKPREAHAFFIPRKTDRAAYCTNMAGKHCWIPRWQFDLFDWKHTFVFRVPGMK